MHELSLCRSLLKIIEKKLAELNNPVCQRIRTIWLEISAVSGVDVESLQFYFSLIIQGTVAANAVLQIAVVPVQAQCSICRQWVTVEHFSHCPSCGVYGLVIEPGRELMIKKMEVG